jgi:hypothetical protein
VFHTPLDCHDDLSAVDVDDLLMLHSRLQIEAERRQKAAGRG